MTNNEKHFPFSANLHDLIFYFFLILSFEISLPFLFEIFNLGLMWPKSYIYMS